MIIKINANSLSAKREDLTLRYLDYMLLYKDIRISDIPQEIRILDFCSLYITAGRANRDKYKSNKNVKEDIELIELLKSDMESIKGRDDYFRLKQGLEMALDHLI